MVTLKDIAQACGVSAATVSRALNGLTDPSGKNSACIRQKAKEMGYFPNAAARTLKTSKSNNIGILYEDRMDHEYFSFLLNGLRSAAEQKGYDITFIRRSMHDQDAGDYSDRARRRNLDGVVVVQADFNSAGVMRLAAGSIPTVVIDHAYEGCDCVMCDNRAGMETIVREAKAMGHEKIACIHGEDGTVTRERLSGFYKACAELGVRAPAAFVRPGHFHDPQSCAQIVTALMQADEAPTCILCPDDFSCLGALSALEKLGLRVPEDVSVIGYDGIRMGQMLHPKLTTLRQDASGAARETLALLLDAIENPETHKPRQVMVTGEMLPGETLGPPK
ncbi:MAG: LacI family DNA-binding transcriptional regulator [Clostridia bacterium]|nr:LacI family DNA-binding transcriptional regulator [Clostridia bacterium]